VDDVVADLDDLASDVATKADDAAVLKLAGDQVAAGTKTLAVRDRGGGVYNVLAYGLVADGVADNTAALNALLATVYAAGGGVLHWPAGVYRIDGQVTLPNDGAAVPNQPGITWRGCSPDFRGRSGNPTGGTILDLRYGAAGDWKIRTLGVGYFGLEGLTLRDSSTSSAHFLLTTNTTLRVVGCAFLGGPAKGAGTCDQDAITLGGTDAASSGLVTSPFQGYGSVVSGNYFNHVRRAVYGRMYCNGVQIVDNTTWQNCGSNLAGDALIVLEGAPGNACTGDYIAGNLIEMNGGQSYGIKLSYATGCAVVGNNFFDPVPATVSYIRFESSAAYNLVVSGYSDDTHPEVTEGIAGTNTILTSHQGQRTRLPQGVTVGPLTTNNTALFAGGSSQTIIQPAAAQTNDSVHLLEVKRSAAEAVNPGGNILRVRQNAEVLVDGAGSGNYIGTYVSWTNNGRTWTALGSGGQMTWDSGSGGSYQDLKGFGQRFYSHTGTLVATLGLAATGVNLEAGYSYKIGGVAVLSVAAGVATLGGAAAVPGSLYVGSNKLELRQSAAFPFQLEFVAAATFSGAVGFGGGAAGSNRVTITGAGTTAATAGLVVTDANGNGTLTCTDDRNVAVGGTLTANAFVGDGSGLTGVARLAFTQTADKTVANTATQTSLFAAGVGSRTVAAGALVVGKTYEIRLQGYLNAVSGQYQVTLKLGGVTLAATDLLTMNVATAQGVEIDALVTCRATGATATVFGSLITKQMTFSGIREGNGGTAAANVDTAIANDLDVAWRFNVADPGNSLTITSATVKALN
jgi:hypothetical protein